MHERGKGGAEVFRVDEGLKLPGAGGRPWAELLREAHGLLGDAGEEPALAGALHRGEPG